MEGNKIIASKLWNVSVNKKNLNMYEIKTSYHGKYLKIFYPLVVMHRKKNPLVRFFDAS